MEVEEVGNSLALAPPAVHKGQEQHKIPVPHALKEANKVPVFHMILELHEVLKDLVCYMFQEQCMVMVLASVDTDMDMDTVLQTYEDTTKYQTINI